LDLDRVPGLKGDFEFGVSGIGGDFFDFVFSYVAGEGFLDVPDAGSNIIFGALGEHFDSTIRTVSDKTCQPVTVGNVKSSVAKADTLNPADENYMFCCLAHLDTRFSMLYSGIGHFNVNPKQVSVQGEKFGF